MARGIRKVHKLGLGIAVFMFCIMPVPFAILAGEKMGPAAFWEILVAGIAFALLFGRCYARALRRNRQGVGSRWTPFHRG